MLKSIRSLWRALDGFLLFSIVIMFAILMILPVLSDMRGRSQNSENQTRAEHFDSDGKRSLPRVSAVNVAPVAYERERSEQIARNLLVSENVELPFRPTMDMRERGKTYEVRFSLPCGSGEDDISLNVSGNIMTLLIDTEERAYMKRIRIPCDYAGESMLRHFVSNQVLYVQIKTQ